ncbi:hypothetical protein BDE02_03G184500 [Populus trichocarpa]|nr:hypothetical protein BDE02_03G184500 [Populus trichocarpa]
MNPHDFRNHQSLCAVLASPVESFSDRRRDVC